MSRKLLKEGKKKKLRQTCMCCSFMTFMYNVQLLRTEHFKLVLVATGNWFDICLMCHLYSRALLLY